MLALPELAHGIQQQAQLEINSLPILPARRYRSSAKFLLENDWRIHKALVNSTLRAGLIAGPVLVEPLQQLVTSRKPSFSTEIDMSEGMKTAVREDLGPSVVDPTQHRVINNESRLIEVWSAGEGVAQGDVYVLCLGYGREALPAGVKPRMNRQVAEGNTQGSRHILQHGELFDVEDKAAMRELILKLTNKRVNVDLLECIGPVFLSPEKPTKDDLVHPEHGNYGFPANSCNICIFQRNLDAEEQAARARD